MSFIPMDKKALTSQEIYVSIDLIVLLFFIFVFLTLLLVEMLLEVSK